MPTAALETASQRSRDSEWPAMALHHCLPLENHRAHLSAHQELLTLGITCSGLFFFLAVLFVAVQAFRWLWLAKTALVHGLLALVAFLVVEHRL